MSSSPDKYKVYVVHKVALIVDDEIEICQLLVSYLKKKKYNSFFSLTIEDALTKTKSLNPDIIFLDNNLPDGSGISNISKLKSIHPESKIVVISARTNLAENAIAHGAAGFVSKPISYQTIDSYL
jgi:two-component system OmpR family response regulator